MTLLDTRRLEEMLKAAEPRVRFLDAALTGGVVQVHPAARTKATALGLAEGLNRQVQEDAFADDPRQIEAIVLKEIYVHLLNGQLDILGTRAHPGSQVQDLEPVGKRD